MQAARQSLSRETQQPSSLSISPPPSGGEIAALVEEAEDNVLAKGPPRLLLQRLNLITGLPEWVPIDEVGGDDGIDDKMADDSYATGLESLIASNPAYLDMLHDDIRNEAYAQAIALDIQPGDHVIDIGTGTGLLAMLAARRVLSSTTPITPSPLLSTTSQPSVVAYELLKPMAALARRIVSNNGFVIGRDIGIVPARSTEQTTSHKADALVMEIFDSFLLGEGVIASVAHARAELLRQGANVIPHAATIYAQVVESGYLASHACHSDHYATTSRPFEMHVDGLQDIRQLTAPFAVLHVNFAEGVLDLEDGRTVNIGVDVIEDGFAHAVIYWFELQLDKAGTVIYTTAPSYVSTSASSTSLSYAFRDHHEWIDHWKQCVQLLPSLASGRFIHLAKGLRARVWAYHNNVDIRFGMGDSDRVAAMVDRHLECRVHGWNSPQRIAEMNVGSWQEAYTSLIGDLFQAEDVIDSVICLGDGLICPATVAAMSVTRDRCHVVALSTQVHQLRLGLEAASAGRDHVSSSVQVVQSVSKLVQVFEGKPMSKLAVLSEPYCLAAEGGLPWHHLQFWYQRSALQSLMSMTGDAKPVVAPYTATLRGVAVSMPAFWRTRSPLACVQGFDLSIANRVLGALGTQPTPDYEPLTSTDDSLLISAGDEPYLARQTWQCGPGYKELTDRFDLLQLHVSGPVHDAEGTMEVPFRISGCCHALVLWLDYSLDPTTKHVVSMGPLAENAPSPWLQAVKLATTPMCVKSVNEVGENGRDREGGKNDIVTRVKVRAQFDSRSSCVSVQWGFVGDAATQVG
eukprot:jgi/Chlat1/6623/Chrsp482S00880